MALNTFKQSQFKLGMNRLDEPTNLRQGEYALLTNGRPRYGGIDTVKLPLEITNLPAFTLMQGIFAADKFLIVFLDGRAYYRDFSLPNENFFTVEGFQMSATAPELFAEIVPASMMNFLRKAKETDEASSGVNLTTLSGSTPACIVVQDGTSQPFIIFPDGTSRQAQTYAQWTMTEDPETDAREYVPVGKQMMYHSGLGILFIIGQDTDGRYTNIFRSVTGRPLDFIVNVDADGDKLPTEVEGGAETVAYRVDYGELTAIKMVSANDNGFFTSTAKTSYLVIPNFQVTFFNEPTFSNQTLFSTGALNNNSVIDLLGDAALIDFTGIRSFNGILQSRVEGKNSPFSANIQRILGDTIQVVTAAADFDNYGFFGVNTIYGAALLVFDTMLKPLDNSQVNGVWVAMDSYLGTGAIKQFASVKTIYKRSLFWIDTNNRLWEYNSSAITATAGMYIGEWIAGQDTNGRLAGEQKPVNLNLVFANVLESGTITAGCYLDSFLEESLIAEIIQDNVVTSSLSLPFGTNSNDTIRNKTLDFKTVSYGWKSGYWITWDFQAKLIDTTYVADVRATNNSIKSTAEDFAVYQQRL